LGLGINTAKGDDPNEMGLYLPYLELGTTNKVVQFDLGGHTCAILDDYSLKCFGLGASGQVDLNYLIVSVF